MSCRWWLVVLVLTWSLGAIPAGADDGVVVAEIGNEKITRVDLERFGASVRRALSEAAPAQSDSALLRGLIDKKALLMAAGEQAIETEPWFGRAVERFRKNKLIEIYQYLEVTLQISITREELEAHFKATRRDRALRISGILLPTREEAEEVLAELAAGSDFAQLSEERSLYEPARDIGGDSEQYLRKDGTMKALQGIFELEVGETSEPIPVPYRGATNFAVIKVTDSIPVELGPISLTMDAARRRHPWIEELFALKKAARQEALLDSLLAVYSPTQTDELQELSKRFAADAEFDFSTVLERTLCVYEGGNLTFGDFTTLVPENNLRPDFLSQQSRVESLLNDRVIPAHLYLAEVHQRTKGEENQRVATMAAKRREDLLVSTVRQRGVDDRIAPPSIEEAMAYYEAHPEQFQTNEEVAVTEILVAFRELAQQLRDKLDAGEDAEELARAYTIRKGIAHHGGRLELSERFRHRDVYEVAKTMDVGQVGGPARVEGGFSVFKVLEKRPSVTKPFNEESRRRASGYVRIEKGRQGYVEYVRQLREKYGTRIYDDNVR